MAPESILKVISDHPFCPTSVRQAKCHAHFTDRETEAQAGLPHAHVWVLSGAASRAQLPISTCWSLQADLFDLNGSGRGCVTGCPLSDGSFSALSKILISSLSPLPILKSCVSMPYPSPQRPLQPFQDALPTWFRGSDTFQCGRWQGSLAACLENN